MLYITGMWATSSIGRQESQDWLDEQGVGVDGCDPPQGLGFGDELGGGVQPPPVLEAIAEGVSREVATTGPHYTSLAAVCGTAQALCGHRSGVHPTCCSISKMKLNTRGPVLFNFKFEIEQSRPPLFNFIFEIEQPWPHMFNFKFEIELQGAPVVQFYF